MVTIEDVRTVAGHLPRAYEALTGGRVKFKVARLVFVSFSHDEQLMGFGFPKEERQMLVDSEPAKFLLPRQSDMRYNWVVARLAALDHEEMTELVVDAWGMCVPKSVFNAYLDDHPVAER